MRYTKLYIGKTTAIKPKKKTCDFHKLNRTRFVGESIFWETIPMTKLKYTPEIRERAVQLLIESEKDYPSLWAAIQAIAPKFGCTPETLRSWHQKHLAKQNPVTISTESQAARIAEPLNLSEKSENSNKRTKSFARQPLFSPRRSSAVHTSDGQIHRRWKRKIWGRADL